MSPLAARSCSTRRACLHIPIVLVSTRPSSDQLPIGRPMKISFRGGEALVTIADLVDSSVAAIVPLDFAAMARLHVVPIDHPSVAIGAVTQVQDLRSLVPGQQKVGPCEPTYPDPLGLSTSTFNRCP